MKNSFFRFRKFVVYQKESVFKVSTESVLLGAWACCPQPEDYCLDIGTGTGLLCLILIQKGAKNITAVDVEPDAVRQANENFFLHNSSFVQDANIELLCEDVLQLSGKNQYKEKFSFIVSNPPYFSKSLKSNSMLKNRSKHQTSMSWNDFIDASFTLLKKNGILTFICPAQEEKLVLPLLEKRHLFITRKSGIIYKPKKVNKPMRFLIECRKSENMQQVLEDIIYVYEPESSIFSEKYIRIVGPFYENM